MRNRDAHDLKSRVPSVHNLGNALVRCEERYPLEGAHSFRCSSLIGTVGLRAPEVGAVPRFHVKQDSLDVLAGPEGIDAEIDAVARKLPL